VFSRCLLCVTMLVSSFLKCTFKNEQNLSLLKFKAGHGREINTDVQMGLLILLHAEIRALSKNSPDVLIV